MEENMSVETKPVWEAYPGFSFPVQQYHSFDLHKSDYDGASAKDLELIAMHVHLAHMLVMARMDEEDYLDLLRSMTGFSIEERLQVMKDWDYVCSVFDKEFSDSCREHQEFKGN